MKISLEKEYDGKLHVACCTNVPGCYVQSENRDDLETELQYALEIYLKNCLDRNQPFPNEPDRPVIDIRIRFERISSLQLCKIFKRFHYHVEYADDRYVLVLNSNFPFNRVIFPNSLSISPLIIKRIVGAENVIHVQESVLRMNTSAS